jgi:hypothetical protein
LTIPPRQQIARFLNEDPFNGGTSLSGTFTFRSSAPVGAVALRGLTNERGEFLMTTLPVSPLSPGETGLAILPHFAAGGGWTTEVVLVNPTDFALSGVLEFQVTAPYNIPPRSARTFVSSFSPTIVTGAVRVTATSGGLPSTIAIFSIRKDGVTVTSAGVPAVRAAAAFEIFEEGAGNFPSAAYGSMGTGVAIANAGGREISVTVERFTLEGLPTGRTGLLTLPAHGHVAVFTHQIPNASPDPSTHLGFQGSAQTRLRISTESTDGISVIALRARYNERGDFLITTTPALAENVPALQPPAVIPHFVNGGGYTTQFVLMNQPLDPAIQGTVRYFSQSGEPLVVPVQ